MRLRIFFVILLCYMFGVVTSNNNKSRVVAKITLKRSFMENYLRNPKPASLHLDIEIPPNLLVALGFGKNMLRTKIGKMLRMQTQTAMGDESWSRDITSVPQLIDHLIEKSRTRFESIIGEYSKKLIKGTVNVTSHIDSTVSIYQSKLNKHVTEILKDNPQDQVDIDVIWLDIIEESNELVYGESLSCLQNMTKIYPSKPKVNLISVVKEIFKKNFHDKKVDFEYICEMINLCRSFPVFSDYLADFIGETITLQDSKLHTLIMKMILIVKERQADVLQVLGIKLVNKLDEHLRDIVYGDLTQIRRKLSAKRQFILDRKKYKKVSESTKAFRILLDIIDKAFDIDIKEKKLFERFGTIIKSIRNWASGRSDHIKEILHTFLTYVGKTLTERLIGDVNKEVRALIHFIIDGNTDIDQSFRYLLVNGSNFVNNKIN